MSRFDYVKYDPQAQEAQAALKMAAQKVEASMKALDEAQAAMFELVGEHLAGEDRPREHAIEALQDACLTEACYDKLQVAYMWCGIGLRDDQLKRDGAVGE